MSIEDSGNINSKRLAKEMLLGIEHRGKDATGFAFIDTMGRVQAHKAPLAASAFVKSRLVLPRRTSTAIMHTRAKTQGSEMDNRNNHPIVVAGGNMVGVHNGMLWNDDDIFRYLGADLRIGQVDSEAIFALLAHSNMKVEDALESLEGSVAVAWMTTDEGPHTLHLARVSQSPLIVGQTAGGSCLFASTEWVLKDTAKELGLDLTHVRHTPEGTHLVVKEGRIEDVRTFEAPMSYSSWGSSYTKVPGTKGTYRRANASSGVITTLPKAPTTPKASETVLAEHLKRDVTDVYPTRELVSERRPGEEQMVSRTMVPTRLFDVLEEVGTKAYFEWYEDREEAIDAWWAKVDCTNLAAEQQLTEKLHVFLRPGDYVRTVFAGREVTAQVINMPLTFPHGEYTLRVRVPNAAREEQGAEEVIILQRRSYEFTEVDPYKVLGDDRDELARQTAAICGLD